MIKNIYNLGDAALYCDFGETVNKETNLKVINYFKDLKKKNISGIKNIAPSYNKLIIYFDLEHTNYKKIKDTIQNLDISTFGETKTKVVKIPVCFDDEFALDLERVEKKIGLVKKEIINQLIKQKYFCYMTGFIAGMPFLGDISKKIKETVQNLDISSFEKDKTKVVKIPVCFDDEFALDLERVEKRVGLEKKEIINQLINQKYFCYMTGFIAGMPFLGDINEKIRLDRLETPRVKVPKGSVGITEQFCNIYTFESPGGWNIIGNSPKKIFTKDQSKLTLIDPGDEVEFFEITKKEYKKLNEQK